METSLIVLDNIPPSYSEELMTEHIEAVLEVDVKCARMIGRSALFSLEQNINDFEEAAKKVKKVSLEGQTIKLLPVDKKEARAAVIYDVKPHALKETSQYIKQRFLHGRSCVSACKFWSKYNLGIIHFKSGADKLVSKLFEKEKHQPVRGVTVIIQPYYYNFHDLVEKRFTPDSRLSVKTPVRSDGKNKSQYKAEDSSESESESDESSDDQCDPENIGEQESDDSCVDQNGRASFGKQKSDATSEYQRGKEIIGEQESDDSSEYQSGSERIDEQEPSDSGEDQSDREVHSEEESDVSYSSEDQIKENGVRHKRNYSDVTGSDGDSTYSESEDDCLEENTDKKDEKTRVCLEKMRAVDTDYDDSKGEQNLSDTEQNENDFQQAKSKDETLKKFEKTENVSLSSETKSLSREREEHAMTKAQYMLLKEHFGTFDNCSVQFIHVEKIAVFEGGGREVSDRHWNMFLDLRDIVSDNLKLEGCLPQLLAGGKGTTFLESLREMESVAYCVDKDELLLASKSINSLSNAAKKLREVLNYKDTFKIKNGKIPQEELDNLKTNLEEKLLVQVSWNVNQEEIFVEGLKGDVLLATKDINLLIEKFSAVTKTFVIEGYVANYIRRYPSSKIKSIFKNVRDWTYDEGDDNGPMTYTFTGEQSSVNEADSSLQSYVSNIVTRKIDFEKESFDIEDIKLIALGLKTEEMKSKIEKLEIQEKCILRVQLPRDSSFKNKENNSQTNPDIFNAGTPCRIQLKTGDIITEKADVRVCVLDESVSLRKTQVGKGFNRACPQLHEQLKTLQKQNPSSLVHIVKGPFSPPLSSCVAVCGVILSVWDEVSSPTILAKVITNVLVEAVKIGAKSVSLPTLGHGKLFKFPSERISEILIGTLKSYLQSNKELDDVIIMTFDREMFDALKLVARQELKPYLQTSRGVESSGGNRRADSVDDQALDLGAPGNLEISVTMARIDDPNKTLRNVTKLIKKRCLHSVSFEHAMLSVLDEMVKEKAENKLIHVMRSTERSMTKLTIKGFDKHVKELESVIRTELNKIQTAMQNKNFASSDAPRRGTLAFLSYAANISEICPSYWTFCQQPNFWKRILGSLNYPVAGTDKKHELIVRVDKTTKKAIVELFKKTWDSTKSGMGSDAKGLVANMGCEVLHVERIENRALFESYAQTRKNLFEKYCRFGNLCEDFSRTLPRGQIKTTEILPSSLREQLYHEVNEHYLFHGTKTTLVDALIQHGPDPKLCTHAMLGSGLYLAEASIKSDQYAGNFFLIK
ncbi:unnamed protein product [Lymnaea stagnalis]|uniref:Poly [ADP-ribose] polymerase n=1 Tax=Lymnaea stagnalis TaxID=6523 RepID=A0AAV2ITR0_LYMST